MMGYKTPNIDRIAAEGMQKEDPTIATLLKAQGCTTGQFGNNHLGDQDEMLPSNHGFDEFFGIADNTIVMYSTDNGAEVFTWPDGGSTMFAGEKATQWEGGFRVPTTIRWPGVIKPGIFTQYYL